MITVKISYSILNTWALGQYEQAVSYYLGKPLPPTPAMELGKSYDLLWTRHIEDLKSLPPELGDGKLHEPRTQVKYQKTIPVNEELQFLLRGVPDLVDGNTIYEFKAGMTEAVTYINSLQLDYYKLLYPRANVGIYLCYNPYFRTYTKGIKYLDRGNAETALNHLYTYGLEFVDYLRANKLLKDYREVKSGA